MANDQQFCLRWNNHQSTLISVFDSLLENGTLVDCTLAAEGQYLKAHKVVLSACSPYLETLLSQHYEKHPIVILKDVKFSELKSMMDYMYRGEVNISQDQLGTFLKAAESLQIKGLSDNGDEAVGTSSAAPKKDAPRPSVTQTARPIESKRPAPPGDTSDASRDGSISPSSLRKRRRTRRPSQGEENHLDSNVCDTAQSTPIVPAVTVPAPVKQIVKQEPNLSINETGLKKEIIDPPTEPLLEPKTEYLDYMNNENSIEVEDLTLDDDDDLDSSMDNSRPGPSHGDMSNQGYPAWPMGDQSGTDEIFMAAQEAVGAATGQQQRDSQDTAEEEEFMCLRCEHSFPSRERLAAHKRQLEPAEMVKTHCFLCDLPCATLESLTEHLQLLHPGEDSSTIYICQVCGDDFRTEQDTVCHLKDCEGKRTVEDQKSDDKAVGEEESLFRVLEASEAVESREMEDSLGMGKQQEYVEAFESIVDDQTKKVIQAKKDIEGELVDLVDRSLEKERAIQALKNLEKRDTVPKKEFMLEAITKIFNFFNTSSVEEIKKGYTCPDCGRSYSSYSTAKAHVSEICKDMEAKHVCEICGFKTRQKNNLRVHIRLVHLAPESYKCLHCHKTFEMKKQYTHHIRYQCVKSIRCEHCSFETKVPGQFNKHMLKVHNVLMKVDDKKTEAPKTEFIPDPVKIPEGFKCPKCHKYFQVVEAYKRHYRTFCNENLTRLMGCMVKNCQYSTTIPYNLQQHLRRKHRLFATMKDNKLDLLDEEEMNQAKGFRF